METEASVKALVALSERTELTPLNEVTPEDLQRIVDGLKGLDS